MNYDYSSCTQSDVIEFCASKGIAITAYSPLGSEKYPLLESDVVKKIADKYSVSPVTVLLSLWANKPNISGSCLCQLSDFKILMCLNSVLTKSVSNARIEGNWFRRRFTLEYSRVV